MQIFVNMLRGGINFNKKKFLFAQDVEIKLAKDSIVLAASMTESIMNFPAPKNITEASAFFCLVEQVSFSFLNVLI